MFARYRIQNLIQRNYIRHFSNNIRTKISTTSVALPKPELLQLLQKIHPDKFVGDHLSEARNTNQKSLSQLNTIIDFGSSVWKEVSRNGERAWFL